MIIIPQRLESRHGLSDHVPADAVGHAEIAGHAEIVAGHQQKLILLRMLAEGLGVRLQRLGEEIERPPRIDALIADLPQASGQQVAVDLVLGKVAVGADGALDDPLE